MVSTLTRYPPTISATAQRALAAAPGVEHAAVAAEWTMNAPNGAQVTAIAVDPASYAALVASSQDWPAVNPALLTGDQVLVSPQALADLGGKTATLTVDNGLYPLKVQVAGTLAATNALNVADSVLSGGGFVLMSDTLAAREPGAVPDVMLLDGPGITSGQLTALADKQAPTASLSFRSQVQAQLASKPVQRGAFSLLILALVVAAALGFAVLLLQLALGAAEREATLARLATMGLGQGQRARLVLLEVLPGVLAAAVAAVACGLALPKIVAPAVNLSVFTGSSAAVPLSPDVVSLAGPLAGLAVAAALVLGIEIRARRKVVATLRGGE
jgi:putative ABC transport system permease protein